MSTTDATPTTGLAEVRRRVVDRLASGEVDQLPRTAAALRDAASR